MNDGHATVRHLEGELSILRLRLGSLRPSQRTREEVLCDIELVLAELDTLGDPYVGTHEDGSAIGVGEAGVFEFLADKVEGDADETERRKRPESARAAAARARIMDGLTRIRSAGGHPDYGQPDTMPVDADDLLSDIRDALAARYG